LRNAILALLAVGPSHGYELKARLDRAFGQAWPPVNIGQVYMTLQRLERDGLVKSIDVPQAGRPPRTDYQLTGTGTEEVKAWFATPSDLPRVRDDFVMKVVIARETGGDPQPLLARQRESYMQSLASLERLAAVRRSTGAAGYGVASLVVEGAALHLQADMKWLDLFEEWLAGTHAHGRT
jgi:DNA-binding PadR family transcriptional regulator